MMAASTFRKSRGKARPGADLVSDSVVGVQDWADRELDGIVSAPVYGQFDLLFGTAFGGVRVSRVNVSAFMIIDAFSLRTKAR